VDISTEYISPDDFHFNRIVKSYNHSTAHCRQRRLKSHSMLRGVTGAKPPEHYRITLEANRLLN
jgi:hypothetical protein